MSRAIATNNLPTNSIGAAGWLCCIYVLIAVGRVHELVPGLGRLPLAKGIVLLWLIAVINENRNAPPVYPFRSPIMRTCFFVFGLIVLSLAFSMLKGASLSFIIGNLPVLAISAVLMFYTVRSWQHFEAILVSMVVLSCLIGAAAIAGGGGGRVGAGMTYDSNDLAYLLVTALPIAIGFVQISKGAGRLMALGACMLLVMGALLTQSRGALVAMALIGACFFVMPPGRAETTGNARRGSLTVRRKQMSRIGILLGFGVIFAGGWTVLPDAAKERLSSITNVSGDYNLDPENRGGRMNVWTRLVKAGLRRPIGSGINASPAVDYYNGGQFRAPHNSVVQVFVELGIIGLFLYLRLHWMTLQTLQHVVTQARENYVEVVNRRREVLARGLQVGLVANFAAAFFLSMAYSNLLWLIFALVAALAASDPTLQPREDTKKTGRR